MNNLSNFKHCKCTIFMCKGKEMGNGVPEPATMAEQAKYI